LGATHCGVSSYGDVDPAEDGDWARRARRRCRRSARGSADGGADSWHVGGDARRVNLHSLLFAPLRAIVPSTCAACGLPGGACCAACRGDLRPLLDPMCQRCGHPLSVDAPRCAQCRGRVTGARAAVSYDGPAPVLVAALKDRGRPALAVELATMMAELTPAPAVAAVMVPIPLTPARLTRRGFNQSDLIAQELGRRWGRCVDRDLLSRTGQHAPQRGASATRRGEQVRGVFRATAHDSPPQLVCLIDDVHTTGATLAAAAQALWVGGTRTITARCFARATLRG